MLNQRRHRTYWDADSGRQITVNLTLDEVRAREAEEAQSLQDRQEAAARAAAVKEAAASGRRKLSNLGLSDAEINALMG